jgi:hypothetical protein
VQDEPVIARATLRIEYSDGSVRECDVPEPRRVRLDIAAPDLSPFGDLDFSYRMPPPCQARRVEMSMDATPFGERRNLITISEEPYILAPDLLPFLDWPASVEENEVWCAKDGCALNGCGPESRGWICSRYGLTARGLLAGIKAHAGSATLPAEPPVV